MPAYAVVRIIEISDPDGFEEYKKLAGPTIGAHGGKVIVGGASRRTTPEGEADTAMVIIEFPSFDQAEAWYGSPEYAAAVKVRESASTAQLVLVESA